MFNVKHLWQKNNKTEHYAPFLLYKYIILRKFPFGIAQLRDK